MYIVTSFFMFHYKAVLHGGDNVHEVQLSVVKHKKRCDNVHEVQLCVVKYEKEVTMYMKYSCVVKHEKGGDNVHEVQLCREA
jgi:hypothetical protein